MSEAAGRARGCVGPTSDPEAHRARLADLYAATFRRTAVVVADPELAGTITRDRNDDYIVALAADNEVDYIVTGDKDLLEWPDQRPPLLTPAAFAALVGV